MMMRAMRKPAAAASALVLIGGCVLGSGDPGENAMAQEHDDINAPDSAQVPSGEEISAGDGAGAAMVPLSHACGEDKPGTPAMTFIAAPPSSVLNTNPYLLAVEILSPYDYTTYTSASWGPPGHWKPWGGDWAGDLWREGGSSCGLNLRLEARAVQVPGGQLAQEIRARIIGQGMACANGQYSSGGYMQKYQIEARYGTEWYNLGWVLMAHLDQMTYPNGTVFDPTSSATNLVGKAFSGSIYSSCWGSCHVHVEFDNTVGTSCYELLPPTTGIGASAQVGVVGGNLSGGNCNVPSVVNGAVVQEGSSSVPASMAASATQSVTVRVQNNGTTTWKKSTLHRLGASASNGVTFSGFGACGGYSNGVTDARVELCNDVPPGGTYDFTFNITAPSGVSSTTLGVQMVQDGQGWFGETQSFPISVTGGGGGCSCSGGSTYWGSAVNPADTSCGFRVCGGDNQLYECTSGGWVSAGGSPCNCRCTNGVNSQGQAINPDHTYCNYQVCGSDHQIYKCTSSGWSGQGTACQ